MSFVALVAGLPYAGYALWLVPTSVLVLLAGAAAYELRRRHMTRWLPAYVRDHQRRRAPAADDTVHLILCIADHFEPKADGADRARGADRVRHWCTEYPKQFARFRDSDGRPPRYSFFFPIEEYEPEYLDNLAELCKQGFGEVEIHLHHNHDTPAGFREKLEGFRDLLASRHGLLGRRRDSGALAYGFIHGNWALCNSRLDGSWCGVNNELGILQQTGCYADFTYPSAPDETQPPIINRIYYAADVPGRPCSHEVGYEINQARPADALMLIEGPLLLDWRQRKWGWAPRLENGCLQASQPPSIDRLELWLSARVQVPQRPDWYFVKLHAHGATEDAHDALLGAAMVRFHEALAKRRQEQPNFHVHYVTAREMYNLVRAAEAGFQGPVAEALDYEVLSNVTTSAVQAPPGGDR